MTPAKPGPKPRDPSALRTVIVRVYLTADEAARLDEVRGTVDRGAWVREAALRKAASRKRAKTGRGETVTITGATLAEVCDG